MIDRSIDFIIGILGILKAGAAVVPLDSFNPIARNRFIAEQVEASVILSVAKYAEQFSDLSNVHVLEVDTFKFQKEHVEKRTQYYPIPSDIGYVLYTSGSTGQPKGVLLSHFSLVDAIEGNLLVQHVTKASRVLNFSSCTFDVCVSDIFLSLATGACLCMASKQNLMNNLAKTIQKMQTTFAFLTPSIASLLDPRDVPSMQQLVLGGEPVSQQLIEQWFSHLRLSVVCGPTEAMIAVVAREGARYYHSRNESWSPVWINSHLRNGR